MEPVEPIHKPRRSGWPRLKDLLARFDASLAGDLPKPWIYTLLAAGLLVRLWRASGTYLNPDEALHFSVANQTTWWLTYTRSLILAHPPLLILVLHAWRTVSSSELMLRLPSILAGTAAGWLAYRWLALLTDQAVSATVLLFTLFLPSSIELSAEVRQYALLLLFSMAAGYLAELALARNSAGAMLFS